MKKLWLAALLNLMPLSFPLGQAFLDGGGRFVAYSIARCAVA